MANDDWKYAVGALAALGLGAPAFNALTGNAQRNTFKDALRAALNEEGVILVNANLARNASGAPVWIVTVTREYAGTTTYHVAFPADRDPYSQATLNELIGRLLTAFQPAGLAFFG